MKKALSALAACVLLAACTKTSEVATTSSGAGGAPAGPHNGYTIPHTLRIGDTQDFDNLNPHLSTSLILGNLSSLTMAWLVRYDAHNEPAPELATEVPTEANGGIGKDGLSITWHLRKGVKWSDGAPFDADDVVFSTNAVNNPKNNEVGRDGWDLITKIDEPDKYTVVFHLKRRYSGYLPTFFGSAGANPCIIPKHILGNLPNINTAPYNSKPVGIGPFRYAEWARGDHIKLEANPYYWRGQPKIKTVIYKVIPDRNTLLTQMQTGEVDMWTFIPAAFVGRATALPGVGLHARPELSVHPRRLQHQPPRAPGKGGARRRCGLRPTGARSSRRSATASASCKNRRSRRRARCTSILPEVPYDVAQANKLLDDAGWVRGADGIRAKNGVRLDLDVAAISGNQDVDARIEQLRSDWQQIGVKVTPKHYNSALFFQFTGGIMYGGKWDVTTFAWQLTPDADLNPENRATSFRPTARTSRGCATGGSTSICSFRS